MSHSKFYSRRSMVRLGIQLPVAGAVVGLLGACGAKQNAVTCADPDDWSLSENGLRKANNYTEVSTDPEKNCLNCAFFKADSAESSCGQCEIFTASAHRNGHCDSWSEIVDQPA
jgi:hypothetical protein